MQRTARTIWNKGFTLVELLIVIALIGVLAVAVLAAINPLEQLNRARDTGMESDASQLLAAVDRYYASQEEFPWVTYDNTRTNDDELLFTSARDPLIGVCGDANCVAGTPGELLENYELKSEFMNRRFIKTSSGAVPGETDQLYLGKAAGASMSVYACWVPTSQSKRQKAIYSIDVTSSARGNRACTTATDWSDLDTACAVCIPQ